MHGVTVKNNFTLHADQCEFMMISRWSLRRKRNNSGKRCKKKYILCSIFFSGNLYVYEVM